MARDEKLTPKKCLAIAGLVLVLGSSWKVKAESGSCKRDEVCTSITKCGEYEYVISRNYKKLRQMTICGTQVGTDEHCCKMNSLIEASNLITNSPRLPVTTTTLAPRINTDGPHRNIGLVNHKLCGRSLSHRIVGGSRAAVKQFPWMALLQYQDAEQKALSFRCSGSLITKKHVLTAAHCLLDRTYKLVKVRLGEHTISTAIDCTNKADNKTCYDTEPIIQDIEAEALIPHNQYSSSLKIHDVGLIRLKSSVVFVNFGNVETICLPTQPEHMVENLLKSDLSPLTMTIAGWGRTEFENKMNDVLLYANIEYVDNVACSEKYAKLSESYSWIKSKIPDSLICAGGQEKKDTCHGDSGGPLIVQARLALGKFRSFQVGIVSTGISGCSTITPHPGLYTRVSDYMPWILDNLSE